MKLVLLRLCVACFLCLHATAQLTLIYPPSSRTAGAPSELQIYPNINYTISWTNSSGNVALELYKVEPNENTTSYILEGMRKLLNDYACVTKNPQLSMLFPRKTLPIGTLGACKKGHIE